jgi:hypothetical protein
VTEQERHRSRGLKWKFALAALVCFVAFISDGSHAYGRLSSGSKGPPRPRGHQSPHSKTGREWNTDGLGINFFFHPYSGGAYFNSARGDRGQVTSIHDLDWLHKYIGSAENKISGIFKPRIAAKLFSTLSLGFGYLYLQKDDYLRVLPNVRKRNGEQKLYLMLYF